MKKGWETGGGAHRNVGGKEPEPLDVSYKVLVGCTPARRAGQEIPDERILREEKTDLSMRRGGGAPNTTWSSSVSVPPSEVVATVQLDAPTISRQLSSRPSDHNEVTSWFSGTHQYQQNRPSPPRQRKTECHAYDTEKG